ncbi:serine-rich adhesin for platelets isoform X3 [Channa argus]|uniref:serine-rich adhesin for platelets isoform X3 n=1 Tax=Channa argus TaxID=215402 RepID=UPI003521C654
MILCSISGVFRFRVQLPSVGRFQYLAWLLADEGVSQSVGQTPKNQPTQSHHSASCNLRQPGPTTDDVELQQPGGHSLQLALTLLAATAGVEHNLTEYLLFHQSDNEFAPLRAYPDNSVASVRFHALSQEWTTQASECGSLSQATVLSDERASSCCSLSQHSLSPEADRLNESSHFSTDKQKAPSIVDTGSSENGLESLGKLVGETNEDETLFLSKDIPAQQLLERLQKDIGMPSSSSAISSSSGMSVKSTASLVRDSKSTKVCKPGTDQSLFRIEGPPGEASLSQQQTREPDICTNPEQSQTLSSEVCNITTGSRSTQPDDTTEALHRELLAEAERHSKHEAESKQKQEKSPTSPCSSLTQIPTEISEGKLGVTRTNPGGAPWTCVFSAGVIPRVHQQQDHWSFGNQTGIDGSYLGFLPQSQSTPGVFKATPKSSVKTKLGQLSVVESDKENSMNQSNTGTGTSPQPDPVAEDHCSQVKKQGQQETTSEKVQFLPSLNYMQKVDAWRANQSSGNTSLFDSLALQGFSGISPKKKAYDAVSDTLNHILSQQVKSLQQPPVSSTANQTVTQRSSSVISCSSFPGIGQAVGSAPNDKDNTVSVAQSGAPPFGRSQSHSSHSTVVMSEKKVQKTAKPPEKDKSQIPNDFQKPSTTVQASPLMTLSQFSDVSVDRVALSSSQDSYNSGLKLRASIGASSVTSLEVDNYAPYWTSKLSTPPPQPRHQELNIEERIPVYLHNLGIDQSPSKILTPFVPRGPIREPEFSPTDLCTIRGSIGTPTKSAEPSEGGSPHKGEFSRSSILSVESSISIPLCVDSLSPAVLIPDQTTCPSLSDTEAIHTASRSPSSSQPYKDNHVSVLHSSQQQPKESSLTSNQNVVQLGQRFGSEVSLGTKLTCGERNVGSPLPTSRSLNQSTEDSFESSKALRDISSLRTKTPRLQDYSFTSSSTAEDPRTHSSFLVARSSSDSMLTSEKLKQSYPSTQALVAAPAVAIGTQDGTATLVLSKPARRTEPEGCSAAPPDSKIPTQPAVIIPLPPVSTQQLSSTSSDTVGAPEEDETTKIGHPTHSRSSSIIVSETDQGLLSDGSSESSLAVRVAKLLQSESPSTMVSSSNSITDQEESKAKEWIKLKISGQRCESRELDKEDRDRIEEIKKDLLLKNIMMSQESTDTESSGTCNVVVPVRQDPPQPVETFVAFSKMNDRTMQGLSTDLPDSTVQLQHPRHLKLEARIHEIAAREGVTLPRTHPCPLKSITIATRKRSTSSSPSTSPAPPLSPAPEPLHLAELSTEAVEHPKANKQLPLSENEDSKTTREAALEFEPSSLSTRNQDPNSQLMSGNKKRQDTVGGQLEDNPSPSQNVHKEDVNDEVSVQDRTLSNGHGAEQAIGITTSASPPKTGHINRVHFTLSPKASDHRQTSAVLSSFDDDVTEVPAKFVPPRYSSSTASSADEGFCFSSPPEWFETREQIRQHGLERTDSSILFKTAVSQGTSTYTSAQSSAPHHRPEVSPGHLNTESSAMPVLLPYKPGGSEELFYVPQTEADVSSTGPSDTTIESSHTGSDDALPPRFSSDILGHLNPGLDRGVTIRHTEGIYSKRFKTATFRMQQPERRDASVATDKSETCQSQVLHQSSQVSGAFTRVPTSSKQEPSTRDQGTSPVPFFTHNSPEPSNEAFQPVRMEMDHDRKSPHVNQNFIGDSREQQSRYPGIHHPDSQQRSLDELWQRFCHLLRLEESRPATEREASLLDRLERLSHSIHNTRAADVPEQAEEYHDSYPINQKLGMRRKHATGEEKRHLRGDESSLRYEAREAERNIGGSKRMEDDLPSYTWTQRLQVEKSQPAGDDSHAFFTSSLSRSSFQSQHLCPADRDGTDTLSTVSGSMSTIDTARLIRAFGAHRVQYLKSSPSLSKLYSTINKQKEGKEQRTGRNLAAPHISTQSETSGTDESVCTSACCPQSCYEVAADSASSTSTYMLPSHSGPSRTFGTKKAVKLVSKGIQAGDLEIVSNGTRRHTRDVGTTFPSPGETSAPRPISLSLFSAERRTGGQRSLSKSGEFQKQRKSKRSPSKPYPEGVSWFISADDLRSEARKENQPEDESSAWRPSTAWFEPYGTRHPWREPLRQRQVHGDRNQQPTFIHHAEVDPELRPKKMSSGLARVSLQEALEMQRPEFISRSRQRMRRLALQMEERKLKPVFTREEDELFRLPKPGTVLLRRAVPRKEMIQRSKQIYENLPEVQRRREEEKRKAEYQSYRLNAKLYNKRITNHVLGRRSAWQ